MKVCHVIINLEGGGAQSLIKYLAVEQLKYSEVYLIVIDSFTTKFETELSYFLLNKGVKVLNLKRKRKSKLSFVISVLRGIFYVNKIKPQVINSHLIMSHLFAEFFKFFSFNKIAHVATIHNSPEKWPKIITLLNKKTSIIYCSENVKRSNNFQNKKSIVIDNGIEFLIPEKKTNIRKELGIQNKKIVLLIGALRLQKNYKLLVEIAKEFTDTDIHFLVCGAQGIYAEKGESSMIFSNIKNIHFLDLRNDTNQLLLESDCFLSCSTYEGLPIAALEAFFSGIPCVLSPIDAHIKIAENIDQCFLPENFDVISFKNKIIFALKNEVDKKDVLKKREIFLDKFSIRNTAKNYQEFYISHFKKMTYK